MALPTSGEISLDMVRRELGRSNTVALGDADVRNLAKIASPNPISLGDLRGKQRAVVVRVTPKTWQEGGIMNLIIYTGYRRSNGAGSVNPTSIHGHAISEITVATFMQKQEYAFRLFIAQFSGTTISCRIRTDKGYQQDFPLSYTSGAYLTKGGAGSTVGKIVEAVANSSWFDLTIFS
ncbi:hypothetical protein [Photobacterium ganghwense]|nr:hypothetical protein [Photobacterium ganghwense]